MLLARHAERRQKGATYGSPGQCDQTRGAGGLQEPTAQPSSMIITMLEDEARTCPGGSVARMPGISDEAQAKGLSTLSALPLRPGDHPRAWNVRHLVHAASAGRGALGRSAGDSAGSNGHCCRLRDEPGTAKRSNVVYPARSQLHNGLALSGLPRPDPTHEGGVGDHAATVAGTLERATATMA